MRIAIHQPNYAPWCGYFAKMRASDVFVFLDDVQIPQGRSYVYRCQIRDGDTARWLSIPTLRSLEDAITAVRFADARWAKKHLTTLRQHYARAPFHEEILTLVEPVYSDPGELLAELNMRLIRVIADYLGLTCSFRRSSVLGPAGTGDDRLLALVRLAGADTYVSGKGGQKYQDPEKFAREGVLLEVREYRPIAYAQGGGPRVRKSRWFASTRRANRCSKTRVHRNL